LEINVSVVTVPDQGLEKSGAFIGVWPVDVELRSSDDFVGITSLTGNNIAIDMDYTVKLNRPGLNFFSDSFKIGLFLTGDDIRSVAAVADLIQGLPTKFTGSTLSLISGDTRSLNVHYTVPPGVNPYENASWLYLYAGSTPRPNNTSEALKRISIKETGSSGFIQMPIDDIFMDFGTYLLQFNPGVNPMPSCSAYSFEIS